jgi:hypothetical protein
MTSGKRRARFFKQAIVIIPMDHPCMGPVAGLEDR